jgi:hypothetical protein
MGEYISTLILADMPVNGETRVLILLQITRNELLMALSFCPALKATIYNAPYS